MSSSHFIECGECKKSLPKHLRIIICDSEEFFHVKCCGITRKTFKSIKSSNTQWDCKDCKAKVLNNNLLYTTNSKNISEHKRAKCGYCHKNIPEYLQKMNCDTCKTFFYVKCSGTTTQGFLGIKSRNESWGCTKCLSKLFPFSEIDNDELFLEMENKSNLINSTPSFTIQSLLDHCQV